MKPLSQYWQSTQPPLQDSQPIETVPLSQSLQGIVVAYSCVPLHLSQCLVFFDGLGGSFFKESIRGIAGVLSYLRVSSAFCLLGQDKVVIAVRSDNKTSVRVTNRQKLASDQVRPFVEFSKVKLLSFLSNYTMRMPIACTMNKGILLLKNTMHAYKIT